MGKAVGLIVVLAVLASLSGAAIAQGRSASGGRANGYSQTYTSHSGPNTPNGPVITGVTASNDDAGVLTFVIHVGNRPSLLPTMSVRLVLLVGVKLKADGTVDPSQSSSVKLHSAWLLHDGSFEFYHDSNSPVSGSSLAATYLDGTATFRLNRTDIGSPDTFLFQANVLDSSEVDARGTWSQDVAPISPAGQAPYTVKIGPPPTVAGSPGRSGPNCQGAGPCGVTNVKVNCAGSDVTTKFTFYAPQSTDVSAEWRFSYYNKAGKLLRRKPTPPLWYPLSGPVGVGAGGSITRSHLEAITAVHQVLVVVTEENAPGEPASRWSRWGTC
jgi:hypothetical protein